MLQDRAREEERERLVGAVLEPAMEEEVDMNREDTRFDIVGNRNDVLVVQRIGVVHKSRGYSLR